MIWSLSKPELSKAVSRLDKAGMLRQTADYSGKLVNAQRVNYFELPPKTDKDGARGRVVMAFAHILSSGHLDPNSKAAYGVMIEPLAENDPRYTNEHAMHLVQEHHVLAEDLALRHGIFTPFGRLTAESVVIRSLMPTKPRAEYAALRIAHLDGLLATVETDLTMNPHSHEIVARELTLAQDYLSKNF